MHWQYNNIFIKCWVILLMGAVWFRSSLFGSTWKFLHSLLIMLLQMFTIYNFVILFSHAIILLSWSILCRKCVFTYIWRMIFPLRIKPLEAKLWFGEILGSINETEHTVSSTVNASSGWWINYAHVCIWYKTYELSCIWT